jgi:hypothetical protein
VLGGVLLLEDLFRLRPELWDHYKLSEGPGGGPAGRRQPPVPATGWAGLEADEICRRVGAAGRRLRSEFGAQLEMSGTRNVWLVSRRGQHT